MTTAAGVYAIGPGNGQLRLYTAREGVAAKVGHDLTITFRTWSGEVVIADNPPSGHLHVDVDISTLEILEGTGGATALRPADRADITSTALRLLDTDRGPHATYTSTRIVAGAGAAIVEGILTLRGESSDVVLTVTEGGPAAWQATATVRQSSFGIKPYKAFFGALRLADEVRIEADVHLTSS